MAYTYTANINTINTLAPTHTKLQEPWFKSTNLVIQGAPKPMPKYWVRCKLP